MDRRDARPARAAGLRALGRRQLRWQTTILKARTEAIEYQSQVAPIAEIVEYLQAQLRTPGVVYVAGLQDGKMINRWKDGVEPQAKTRLRLRHAYHAARIIVEAYDRSTAEAWFFGSNTELDDEAPARVLRNAQTLDDLRLVVPAAKGFARIRE